MDNAREVNPKPANPSGDLIEKTTMHFLEPAAREFQAAQEKYDLNAEFAKTKKNRNFLVAGSVLGVIVVFSVVAFLINSSLEQNNKLKVDSNEFQAIDDRDLVNESSKIETQLSQTQAELDGLQGAKALDLEKLKNDVDQQTRLARARILDPAELSKAIDAINQDSRKKIDKLDAKYKAQIAEDLANIESLKTKLASFDQTALDQAKKREILVNSERRVNELERDKLKATYEDRLTQINKQLDDTNARADQNAKDLEKTWQATLKREQDRLTLLYNPIYADANSKGIIDRDISAVDLNASISFPKAYRNEGLVKDSELANVNGRLSEFRTLLGLLEKVPYLNSVPGVLKQMKAQIYLAIDATVQPYDNFWQTILDQRSKIANLNAQIADLKQQIVALNTKIDGLDQTIADQKNTIAAREATIAERDATIADDAKSIADRDAKITEQAASLDDLTQSLSTTKADLDDKSAKLADANAALAEKDKTLQQLTTANSQLTAASGGAQQTAASLTRLYASLDSYAKAKSYPGLVIDTTKPNVIGVYIANGAVAKQGGRAFVYKAPAANAAKNAARVDILEIEFLESGSLVTAKIVRTLTKDSVDLLFPVFVQ